MNTKQKKLQRLVFGAMFCALVFAATWISIPTPTIGNVNLGDAVILLSAWMLGGVWAVLAAGVGAALTDLVAGYAIYVPATFLIKALMVLVVIGCRRFGSKTPRSDRFWRIVSAVMAEALMVVGYFLYEALVLKYGWAAAANIPFNAVQGSLGIVLAIAVYELLIRAGIQISQKK